jgi:hypothetical protein
MLNDYDATQNKKLSRSGHLQKYSFENEGPQSVGKRPRFQACSRSVGPRGGISLPGFWGASPAGAHKKIRDFHFRVVTLKGANHGRKDAIPDDAGYDGPAENRDLEPGKIGG